jgi:hypothetical protein
MGACKYARPDQQYLQKQHLRHTVFSFATRDVNAGSGPFSSRLLNHVLDRQVLANAATGTVEHGGAAPECAGV